jgi:hypothetical protein
MLQTYKYSAPSQAAKQYLKTSRWKVGKSWSCVCKKIGKHSHCLLAAYRTTTNTPMQDGQILVPACNSQVQLPFGVSS